jgi:hypothetical protein
VPHEDPSLSAIGIETDSPWQTSARSSSATVSQISTETSAVSQQPGARALHVPYSNVTTPAKSAGGVYSIAQPTGRAEPCAGGETIVVAEQSSPAQVAESLSDTDSRIGGPPRQARLPASPAAVVAHTVRLTSASSKHGTSTPPETS